MRPAHRYHADREQLAIAAEMGASLDKLLPISRLHAAPHESEQTWRALEELGLFGVSVSEARGGSGLGAAEETLIAMNLGRRLIASGVVATMAALHLSAADRAGVHPVHGSVMAGYRQGDRVVAVAEPRAKHILIRSDESAMLVRAGEMLPLAHGGLWLADLHSVSAPGETIAAFSAPELLHLTLLDAAVLTGIAEAALSAAVEYAGVRRQFGQPIGAFQAVKHHCANMAIAARRARDQASFAATALDLGREDAALQIECAFVTAAGAAVENAGMNIQIHGGLGFSDEAEPHLLLKRALLYTQIGGGLEAGIGRVAAIAPLP